MINGGSGGEQPYSFWENIFAVLSMNGPSLLVQEMRHF